MKQSHRWFLFFLSACLFFCGVNRDSAAKVYIDIDAPGFQQFPIAVCDLQAKKIPPDRSAELPSTLSDHIRSLLTLTGLFHLLDPKSFLEGVEPGTQTVRFSDWTMIGADFLVRGGVVFGVRDLTVDCQLYDVSRGLLLFNKSYAGSPDDVKTLARAVVTDILLALTGDEGDFNTKIAFVMKKQNHSDIFTINYDGTDLKPVTSHQSIVVAPRWSPDGQYMAFTSYRAGRPEVNLYSLKTGKEKKIAAFKGLNLCGAFSPDSKKLLLTLSKDDNEEIYVLDLDSQQLSRLTHNSAIDVSPTWSPDGKKIAFVSNRSGSPQIFVMDADGGNVKRITFEGNYNTSPSWSPRGNRIAYEGLINHRYQIFTVDEDGGNLLQLTFDNADNEYPSWSPSGRQIVFSSKQETAHRISIMNFNGLNVRVLKESKVPAVMMPAWSPRLK
jgi:TolB protein